MNPEPSDGAPMATPFIRLRSLVGDRATSAGGGWEVGRGEGRGGRTRTQLHQRENTGPFALFLFAIVSFSELPVTFAIVRRPPRFHVCSLASFMSNPFNRKAFAERKT